MEFLSECREGVFLSAFSTFGIGGAARFFFEPKKVEDLQKAFRWAFTTGTEVLVVGRGSNCLFADDGFDGLVIKNSVAHCKEESGTFSVGGGYSFSRLGVQSARSGLGGLEFAAGIPGTVGGAVYMNAGAHGQCTADIVSFVDYVNEKGERISVSGETIEFGYRYSSFQHLKGAIASVDMTLNLFPEAFERQKEMLKRRKGTQPYHERSAGCSFRNPPGTSAGKLIEEAGLKGVQIGGAQISTMHANFIINTGGAKASDVIHLLDHVREMVYRKTGVLLEPEVRIIERGG